MEVAPAAARPIPNAAIPCSQSGVLKTRSLPCLRAEVRGRGQIVACQNTVYRIQSEYSGGSEVGEGRGEGAGSDSLRSGGLVSCSEARWE